MGRANTEEREYQDEVKAAIKANTFTVEELKTMLLHVVHYSNVLELAGLLALTNRDRYDLD